MEQQNVQTENRYETVKGCIKDCRTILDAILILYYDELADIDSSAINTKAAKRYLDGYAYVAEALFAVFGEIVKAEEALEVSTETRG